MITISELFPLYRTALKWQSLRTPISTAENVRLVKEFTIHTDNGNEVYTVDGMRHREDGPAYIDKGKKWTYQHWYKFGNRHRQDGPAILDIRKGVIVMESWYVNGKLHREDGPSYTHYHTNGQIEIQEWRINNRAHREGAPANIHYRRNGTLEYEEWWFCGKLHRENGPATIEYDEDGVPIHQEWWVQDAYMGCEPSDDDLIVQEMRE